MRRLKLLQMVHWERQRLAELVAKKNKGGIDNVDTLPMCDEEIQRLAGIEAFDTPQEYCTTDLNGNRPTKKDNKNTKCKDDKKALLSRKSCAYKKARREALQSGKTPEEANSAAKKAYAETK
eukprot:g21211.t1